MIILESMIKNYVWVAIKEVLHAILQKRLWLNWKRKIPVLIFPISFLRN